jgi:hypothetical protein
LYTARKDGVLIVGAFYTWDAFHGEIEVFNSNGRHLGVLNALSGEFIKDAVKGRRIDV